jgi:hypothetical protein
MTMRALVLGIALLVAGPVFGQTSGRDLLDVAFSTAERRLISEYFKSTGRQAAQPGNPAHGHGKGKGRKDLPPGLAKRDGLPPGLAKKQQLPPGLGQVDLPRELAVRLPKVKPGYRRVIVEDDVLLVQIATDMVIDVLIDMARGR